MSEKIFNRVKRNKKTYNIETILVTKGGREIFVEGNVHVRVKDKKFVAIQGIFHDVTERKLIEHSFIAFKYLLYHALLLVRN